MQMQLAKSHPDPYWNNVVLLVGNDNAVNGTTIFPDMSASAKVITRVGTATYSNTTAPTGMSTSISLNGTSWLTAADSADWNLGSGDFTIEGMANYSNAGTLPCLIGQSNYPTAGDQAWSFYLPTPTDPELLFELTGDGSTLEILGQGTVVTYSTNTWYHFAVSRIGSVMRIFMNGTKQGADLTFLSNSIFNSSQVLHIGSLNGNNGQSNWNLNGYMSNIRITKGVARYTSNFTPPTLPLPN